MQGSSSRVCEFPPFREEAPFESYAYQSRNMNLGYANPEDQTNGFREIPQLPWKLDFPIVYVVTELR